MCAILKKEGIISSYETAKMSGKVKIKFPNGYKRTYGTKFDLLPLVEDRPSISAELRSHLQNFLLLLPLENGTEQCGLNIIY